MTGASVVRFAFWMGVVLPLIVVAFAWAGALAGRRAPRVHRHPSNGRSAAMDEINQILRDDLDEPATCMEELERANVDLDLDTHVYEPWAWERLRDTHALLDLDFARDSWRGK